MSVITLTIRCSNQTTFAATPYKTLVLTGYALKPRWKDAEDSGTTPDVGGYRGNSIARIREYEFVIVDLSVAEDDSDNDYGVYHNAAQFLYAKKLWIESVANSPRIYRNHATPTTAEAFWTDGKGIDLPQEVRRVSFDAGDGENGSLSPVLVLEDVSPLIGVGIS